MGADDGNNDDVPDGTDEPPQDDEGTNGEVEGGAKPVDKKQNGASHENNLSEKLQFAYGPLSDPGGLKGDDDDEVWDEVTAEPVEPPRPPPPTKPGEHRSSKLPPPAKAKRPDKKRHHTVALPPRRFPPKTVGDVMTRKLIAISEQESLRRIEDGMREYRVRHFPVVDANNKLMGLVSWDDVLLASSSSLSAEREARDDLIHKAAKAEDVMQRGVLTVRPDMPIEDAVGIMQLKQLRCLPVTDEEDTLVGILSDSDLVKLAMELLASRPR